MKLTQNKLSIILATVVAGTAIIMNCTSASAAINPMNRKMENRYIISGYVDEVQEFNNGIRTAHIIDQNGEEWVYSYGYEEECPAEYSKVTMIMNNNGTADFHDDMIEDVLFCNDCENIED